MVTINDDAYDSPQTISLVGTGQGSVVSLSATSETFGNQATGLASAARSITLSNPGGAVLNIASIVASGDFTRTTTCGATLARGANCSISVTFTPTAVGARTGSVVITSDAASSPNTITLSGTGVATPWVTLGSTALSFGAQDVGGSNAVQSVVLTNTGAAALNLTSITASGDFSVTNNCGGGLGASGSCSLNVTFTPTAAGNRTGTITISSNAPGSPHTVGLSGTAAATAIFPNNRATYSIVKTSTGFSVTDRVGNGGTIPLSGATQIRFADMTVNLLIGDLSKTIAAADLKTLIELYVAFFDRIPDADGVAYWINQFKGGMTLDQIANSFYSAAIQYSSLTGYSASMSDADFVRIIYDNVLGRTGPTAPSDTDVHYWSDQITSGTVTRARLITIILGAAHGYKGDATWGWVADLLDNKFSVANYFCIQQGLNYNTPADSITKGMAIAAAVTPTSTAAALTFIGVTDTGFDLTAAAVQGPGGGR